MYYVRKKILCLGAIAAVVTATSCSRSPLENTWRFERISNTAKMTADFNAILYKISDPTRKYMRETGLIQANDSIVSFIDSSLTIRFFQTRALLPMFQKRFATGTAGCANRFKIRYVAGGGKLFFKEIRLTRLPCGSQSQNFFFMYREYLFASNEYQVKEDTLLLRNLYGNELSFIKIGSKQPRAKRVALIRPLKGG